RRVERLRLQHHCRALDGAVPPPAARERRPPDTQVGPADRPRRVVEGVHALGLADAPRLEHVRLRARHYNRSGAPPDQSRRENAARLSRTRWAYYEHRFPTRGEHARSLARTPDP